MLLQSKDGGRRTPAINLAMEEALFLRNRGLLLRVWENDESVILGRAQLANFETDVALCEREGIPIVRRFTAGGTVYHGPGNLNWSLFVARGIESGLLRYVSSPHEVFRVASRPVISALTQCGIAAWLEPPNRIFTAEGKISGMAAYVSKDGSLCHGTLLTGADLSRVKALTTPAPQKIQRRYTRSHDVKTANVKLDVDSFIRTLVRAVADESGLAMKESTPDTGELELARELLASRYARDEWNLGDPFLDGKLRATVPVR